MRDLLLIVDSEAEERDLLQIAESCFVKAHTGEGILHVHGGRMKSESLVCPYTESTV